VFLCTSSDKKINKIFENITEIPKLKKNIYICIYREGEGETVWVRDLQFMGKD